MNGLCKQSLSCNSLKGEIFKIRNFEFLKMVQLNEKSMSIFKEQEKSREQQVNKIEFSRYISQKKTKVDKNPLARDKSIKYFGTDSN